MSPGAGVTDRERTLDLLLRDWPMVLLRAGTKAPLANGEGSWTISRDPAIIGAHLDQGGGVGLLCGAKSALGIDIDNLEAYAEMSAMLGPLPAPWVRTGRAGHHHYLRFEAGLPAVILWRGQHVGDIKRGGGDGQGLEQCVLPPSLHPAIASSAFR